MNALARIALSLNQWTSRWVPSSLSIAILLTLLTLILGTTLTESSFLKCIQYWGDGFWELLSFSMQMTLIVVTGYIVVVSPPMSAFLRWCSRIPKSSTGAVAFTALVSMLLAWVNWGLGIIGSAVLVRYMARQHEDVDYPLLVAVAYFGLGCTWHAGLSASAPILVATPGHFMAKETGIIPLTQTIFHPFNLMLTLIVLITMTAIAFALHPRQTQYRTRVNAERIGQVGVFQPPLPEKGGQFHFADLLDYKYGLNLVVGILGLLWLVQYLAANGWARVTINTVNFLFLMVGVLLHRSPAALMKAAAESSAFIYNIILQFPFYAGMYGIIKGSGLSNVIGDAFVRIAGQKTLPLIVYWYSGIVNYFVPSGGSKWAVEAPYIVEAAKRLGVGLDQIVVSYAWGDMMTDLLQPFWAIPLLTTAGVEFKQILGYEMIAFICYAFLVSVFFYFMPFY